MTLFIEFLNGKLCSVVLLSRLYSWQISFEVMFILRIFKTDIGSETLCVMCELILFNEADEEIEIVIILHATAYRKKSHKLNAN